MLDLNSLTKDQEALFHWITEREKCRLGREQNLPKPWSDDMILQSYRFCNVRREDDKVTKWIKDNWRDPYDTDLWKGRLPFAMCIARLFNRPETLSLIGFPTVAPSMYGTWLEHTRSKLKSCREMGGTIFTGAYLVSTNGRSMDKIDYILDCVLSPIWYQLRSVFHGDTLESYHAELMRFDGMGSFMAGQVIADLKYTSLLRGAADWDSWAPLGPGSKRGLNRFFGHRLEANIKTEVAQQQLLAVKFAVRHKLGVDLPVHDVQNCMCEYDKYLRVLKGEGKPRSGYNGRN